MRHKGRSAFPAILATTALPQIESGIVAKSVAKHFFRSACELHLGKRGNFREAYPNFNQPNSKRDLWKFGPSVQPIKNTSRFRAIWPGFAESRPFPGVPPLRRQNNPHNRTNPTVHHSARRSLRAKNRRLPSAPEPVLYPVYRFPAPKPPPLPLAQKTKCQVRRRNVERRLGRELTGFAPAHSLPLG